MNSKIVDLHAHTTESDGSFTPEELILEASELFPIDVKNTLYVSKDVLKKLSSMESPSNVMAVVYKRKNKVSKKACFT